MKRIIFSLLAVALLASCQDKTAYTIEGTVANVEDNAKAALYEDWRGKTVTDSAIVKDGKFSFEGKQIEPIVRFLAVEGVDARPIMVVIEGGNIKVAIDEKSTVTGTPLNDKNKAFGEKMEKIEDGKTQKSEFVSFIKENATNALGVSYFETSYYMLELDELKEVLALIPTQLKGTEALNKIEENVKLQDATAIGSKFIDIAGLTPEGKEIALSEYAGKGKIVLIDFWASWCPPCVKDMPHLVAAYAKYKNKGFEIVGVSLDKTNEDWAKGIKDLNITWPQMSDLKFWDSELSKPYAVSSIPYTVLIDGEGTIIAKRIGGEELDAKLEELLSK